MKHLQHITETDETFEIVLFGLKPLQFSGFGNLPLQFNYLEIYHLISGVLDTCHSGRSGDLGLPAVRICAVFAYGLGHTFDSSLAVGDVLACGVGGRTLRR
jgi:hypothetical protein